MEGGEEGGISLGLRNIIIIITIAIIIIIIIIIILFFKNKAESSTLQTLRTDLYCIKSFLKNKIFT